ELAVEVVGREEGAGPAVLLKSQMFWLGALGALLFNLYFIIPSLDPLWPVPRSQYDFHDLGLDLPWKAGGPGPYLRLNPLFFGLGFLVPLDLLLTVWVMVIVLKIEAVVASTFGVPYYPLFHIRFQQGMGAYVGLALVMLWAGRRYTLSALGDFFRRPGKIDPDGPGKWTLVGLAGGTAFLLVFFIRVGMVAWFAVLFLALVLVRVLVMARVRAQAGIPNIYLHVVEIRSFVWMLGGGTLAALGEVTLAALVFLSFLIWCTYVTPYQADGFRIAEITGLGGRRWIWLSTLAAASGFALASFFQIHALYAEGFGTLRQPLSIWPANEIFNAARASDPIDPLRLTLMAVGLATTAGLALLQGVWHWFPFSPLGFVVACAIGDYVGAMLLITWLVKRCVLKFGGAPAYQAARTSCIGLVFAHLTIAALWGLLGLFDLPPTKRYVIGFW
ncbi:MAG: hypothetical protein HYU43_04690, partial [Armatimonadetes bacterium]|nr:hypothetical protein [Armatimonadota bacterium]